VEWGVIERTGFGGGDDDDDAAGDGPAPAGDRGDPVLAGKAID
jgi:hypothetical protein